RSVAWKISQRSARGRRDRGLGRVLLRRGRGGGRESDEGQQGHEGKQKKTGDHHVLFLSASGSRNQVFEHHILVSVLGQDGGDLYFISGLVRDPDERKDSDQLVPSGNRVGAHHSEGWITIGGRFHAARTDAAEPSGTNAIPRPPFHIHRDRIRGEDVLV